MCHFNFFYFIGERQRKGEKKEDHVQFQDEKGEHNKFDFPKSM